MKPTRTELDDLLVDYLYDELPEDERARFEAALVDHPDLEAEVAAHRRTRRAVQSLPETPLPAAAFARIEDIVMAAARQAALESAPPVVEPAAEAAAPRLTLVGSGRSVAEAKPTFWERLTSLLAQPAFATALAAVLVVGVATVLTQAGKDPGALTRPRPERMTPASVADEARNVAEAPRAEPTPAEMPAPAPEMVAAAAPAPVVEEPAEAGYAGFAAAEGEKREEAEALADRVADTRAAEAKQVAAAEVRDEVDLLAGGGPKSKRASKAAPTREAARTKSSAGRAPSGWSDPDDGAKVQVADLKKRDGAKGSAEGQRYEREDQLARAEEVVGAAPRDDAGRGPVLDEPAQVAEASKEQRGGLPSAPSASQAPTEAKPAPVPTADQQTNSDKLAAQKAQASTREAEAKKLEASAEASAKAGDYAKARVALLKLGALPGYEKEAKEKLEALAKAEKAAEERLARERAAAKKAATEKATKPAETVPSQKTSTY